MFKLLKILSWLVLVSIAAFALARFTTQRALTHQGLMFDKFERVNPSWLYSDTIGNAAASDLERARVAINGPLGLSNKEAVYFVANRDAQGAPLKSQCTYQIVSSSIDSRWWSVTLYDNETQNYVENLANRSSWNSVNITRSDGNEWTINIASEPQAMNWLPAPAEPGKPFDLILRVYNPSMATRSALPHIELPEV